MKHKKLIIIGIAALVLFITFVDSCTIVRAGTRGVLLRLGAVKETILDEGLHFTAPFVDRVVKMDVRIQKVENELSAGTKDLQTVEFIGATNYSIDPAKANTIYQTLSKDYEIRIINPTIQETVKNASAKYTAEGLIGERTKLSEEILTNLKNELAEYDIIVNNFSVINFDFNDKFNEAIEAKVKAEQEALKAEKELQRVEFEAQQLITQAQAEAESLKLRRQQITPLILQAEAIKKWNGILPTYIGGDQPIPFLNIK